MPQVLSLHATTTEVFAQQQQKPFSEKPVHCRSSPHLSQLETACAKQSGPRTAKQKKNQHVVNSTLDFLVRV